MENLGAIKYFFSALEVRGKTKLIYALEVFKSYLRLFVGKKDPIENKIMQFTNILKHINLIAVLYKIF